MSSILDALRKLEGEKPAPGGEGPRKDLFEPPPRPRRGLRGAALGVLALLIAVGAWLALRDRHEAPRPAAHVAKRAVQPAPVAKPAPSAARTQFPLTPPSPEAKKRREAMLARVKELKARARPATPEPPPAEVATPPVVAVSPPAPPAAPEAAPPAPPASAPVAAAAPAPAPAVRSAPRVASAPAGSVRSTAPRAVTRKRPAPSPSRQASAAPLVKPAAKPAAPRVLVTEVTWHDDVSQRSASLQIGSAKPRVVREGDRIEGVRVVEIRAGAVQIEMAGDEMELDVGESAPLRREVPPVYH